MSKAVGPTPLHTPPTQNRPPSLWAPWAWPEFLRLQSVICTLLAWSFLCYPLYLKARCSIAGPTLQLPPSLVHLLYSHKYLLLRGPGTDTFESRSHYCDTGSLEPVLQEGMVGVRQPSRWLCSAGALAVPFYKAVFTEQNVFAKASLEPL